MTNRLYVPDRIIEERRAAKEAASQKQESSLDTSRFLGDLDDSASALDRLPKPTGWRLLILPYTPPKQTESGIHLADETVERNRLSTNVGYVVSVGPDAYNDTSKFPDGPWCKAGDWVLFGRYAGSRFKIDGAEPRILNDDEIIATINDPRDIISL